MTPADLDRVFGRGRLRMVTGDHVEVYREESAPGERRRYTKRFLATAAGDFRPWTEREWRILARLVGHGIGPVPDVVQFDRGGADRAALVQTYDAGITVDHWATLLPVQRDAQVLRHVFEDRAHWWALAHHCLIALDAIHELQLVHLDLKADNVCIPLGPPDFDPQAEGQRLYPCFEQITLIDFAFSLVSGERLETALPIAAQPGYDYQSPRLVQALDAGRCGDLLPTRQLDWRCDLFSLAAMLRRYLPDPERRAGDWTAGHYAQARALVRRLVERHDADTGSARPHAELIAATKAVLAEAGLAESLQRGWTLAERHEPVAVDTPTPVTRIALPVSLDASLRADATDRIGLAWPGADDRAAGPRPKRRLVLLAAAALGLAASVPLLGQAWLALQDHTAAQLAQAAPEIAAPLPTPAPVAAPEASELAQAADDSASAVPREAVEHDAKDTQQDDAAARTAVAVPAPAATPRAVAANPEPAGVPRRRSAPVAVTAPQRPKEQVAARPSNPAAGRMSERERALAYLRARGPAPLRARAGAAQPPGAAASAPAASVAALPPVRSAATGPAPAQPDTAAAPLPATSAPPAAKPPDDPPSLAATSFAARARELMDVQLPRAAQRAERLVLRVLFAAARSADGSQDDVVRETANAIQRSPDEAPIEIGIAADDARTLNEAARVAYDRRASVQEAFGLQSRAFGANPLDAEVVGNLAYLYLRQRPAQPEAARQLALHALTLRDPRYPGGRLMDWTTLAIASALSGRERDSRNAWFVTLAMGSDLERHCRIAIDAYAAYGERLRAPVAAMMSRIHTLGRAERTPTCAWPPQWTGRATPLRQ